jgi:hypothetical protein
MLIIQHEACLHLSSKEIKNHIPNIFLRLPPQQNMIPQRSSYFMLPYIEKETIRKITLLGLLTEYD